MPTRRALAGAVLGGGVLAAAPRGAGAQTRDLTVVSWGGAYQEAQREALFRPYQQRGGQRLLEETWEGGPSALRERLRAGAWDVVQLTGAQLRLACSEGLVEALDPGLVGGEAAYRPEALAPCGVGAVLYAAGLAHDADRGPAPEGWPALLDLGSRPGPRALPAGPRLTLEAALMADGVPPGAVYDILRGAEGPDRALRCLGALRGSLLWWERASEPVALLARGEAALALAPNGRVAATAARAAGAALGFRWEGALHATAWWAVPRGSPNLERALAFLRFAAEPGVQAALPPRIPYAPAVLGVEEALPPEVLEALPTAPGRREAGLVVDESFWARALDPLTERFESWRRDLANPP